MSENILRSAVKSLRANKKGQTTGHRAIFRNGKRVFLELTAEERENRTRRQMAKAIRAELEQQRVRRENGLKLLTLAFNGWHQYKGPQMTDAEFIWDNGEVNLEHFTMARHKWLADMEDLLAAARDDGRFGWNKDYADTGALLLYRVEKVRRA